MQLLLFSLVYLFPHRLDPIFMNAHNAFERRSMAKKKETIQDILDRINEDIENIREKVEILESEVESDFDDEEDEE